MAHISTLNDYRNDIVNKLEHEDVFLIIRANVDKYLQEPKDLRLPEVGIDL